MKMSPSINKDQDIMNLQSNSIFDQDRTYQESYNDPLSFWYYIHNDPLSSQEKSVLSSPIQHPPTKKHHYIHSMSSNDLIQN